MIVVGYVGSLWLAPLVWGQPLASLDGALVLGGWLAVLVVAAEVVRMRARTGRRDPGRPARPRNDAGSARNACAWPGTSTT